MVSVPAGGQGAWAARAASLFVSGFQAGTGPGGARAEPGAGSALSALQDFIDPETRKKLYAQHADTRSLIQKLASGGENAKEAAARKAGEAKRKLEMLKMQAQLAAAAGDRKAAARIAKEAAQVARELGQAVKGGVGGVQAQASSAPAPTGTNGETAVTGDAIADPEAGIASTAPGQALSQNPPDPRGPAIAPVAAAAGGGADAGDVPAVPSPAGSDLQAASGQAPAAQPESGQTRRDDILPEGLAERRDAILRDGAERKAQAEFQAEIRRIMDGLRSVHRQMKGLAEKDGSTGTKAAMQSAARDMADADRLVDQAFGGAGTMPAPGPVPGAAPSATLSAVPSPLDIRV